MSKLIIIVMLLIILSPLLATSGGTARANPNRNLQWLNDRANGGYVQLEAREYTVDTLVINNSTIIGQGYPDGMYGTRGTTIIVNDGIQQEPGGSLQDVRIKAGKGFTDEETIYTVGGDGQIFNAVSDLLKNVIIYNPNYTGTGLHFKMLANTWHSYIVFSSFGHIALRGFREPFKITAEETAPYDAFFNANHMEFITVSGGKTLILMERLGVAAISSNTFPSIMLQPQEGTVDGLVLRNVGQSSFQSVIAFDWSDATGTTLILDEYTLQNYIRGYFFQDYINQGIANQIIDMSK